MYAEKKILIKPYCLMSKHEYFVSNMLKGQMLKVFRK